MKQIATAQFIVIHLLLFFSIDALAQVETLKAHTPVGAVKNLQVDMTQFIEVAEKEVNMLPSLIIVNTDIVSVPEDFQEDFQDMVSEQNTLWQYRYLHRLCEGQSFSAESQRIESQMFMIRKEVHTGNYVADVMEKNLQAKLQEFFSSSVCFAYRINLTDSLDMRAVGERFHSDWVIYPSVMKVDTTGEDILTQLQVEVWDTRKDTLVIRKVFEGKAADIEESVATSIKNASDFLAYQLILDKEFKAMAKLSFEREKVVEGLLAQQPDRPWVKELLQEYTPDYYDDYRGSLANEDESRFLAFSMKPYTPDFEHKISDRVINNTYRKVDASKDIDPQRARFRSHTILGIKVNGEWVVMPVKEDFIYTSEDKKALKIYLSRFENLGFFKPGSTKLYDDYWFKGFLNPVDAVTADKIQVKNWEQYMSVDERNMIPYQGLPHFMARELLMKYQWTTSRLWEEKICDDHLRSAFKQVYKKADDIKFIDRDVRRYDLIHDYELTRGLIPLWILEKNGKEALRIYYWHDKKPDELYEWTYLPKVYFDENAGKVKGQYLNEQMSTILPWNYFCAAIYSDDFWETYVLAKEDGSYKYLVKSTE